MAVASFPAPVTLVMAPSTAVAQTVAIQIASASRRLHMLTMEERATPAFRARLPVTNQIYLIIIEILHLFPTPLRLITRSHQPRPKPPSRQNRHTSKPQIGPIAVTYFGPSLFGYKYGV